MRVSRIAMVALILMAATGAALAQSGGLKVIVSDSAGPLPGATVTITNEMGYVKPTSLITDAKGVVDFPVLRAGTGYSVIVSFPGFTTIENPGIRVRINDNLTLPIQLFEEMVEKVIVDGTRDVVDLDKTEQSTRFSDEFIQDLPVPGRFYQNVLTMAPGVQDDNGDGNPTVHGSRSRDFKAVVSGASNVDPLTGRFMSLVNPNSIEEMEVITAGAGVEFGRAQGGFARIIQKQGSNQFEGLAEVIWRTSKLDGNGAGNFQQSEFDWVQPSVQLSGPIVKDKLWYRLSHEYIFRELPINVGSSVQVTTTQQGINSDQLTWQVSPRNKLAFILEWNPQEITNAGVSSLVGPQSSRSFDNGFRKYSLSWTAPYSPKVLVDTTVAYQDLTTNFFPTDPLAANNCVGEDNTDTLRFTRCFNSIEGEVTGAYPVIWDDNSQRFSLSSMATLYAGNFIGMNHQVKVGLSIENERYYRVLTRNPQLQLLQQGQEQVEGEPIDIQTRDVLISSMWGPQTSASSAAATVWGFYVEDKVKPAQNLTLTIGARIDRESTTAAGQEQFDTEAEFAQYANNFDFASGAAASAYNQQLYESTFTGFEDLLDFIDDLEQQIGNRPQCSLCSRNSTLDFFRRPENITLQNTNISPFLSIAWDPWSNGKTAISASAGRKYNTIPLVIPMQEYNPARAEIELSCDPGTGADCRPSTADVAPTISVVDRNLRTPYVDEWTVSFQREIAAETSIRLSYIDRQYKDQIQDVDLNHAPGDFGRCVTQNNPRQPTVVPVVPGDPDFDPNNPGGDGILDDCAGELIADPNGAPGDLGQPAARLQRPDGVADLYTQSPIWGDVFLIGNFNYIDYQGITLELTRRQYRGWEMQASYTYSTTFGNGEDFFQDLGDDRTLVEDEAGYQSNDRRHVVKFAATTITPWGFRLGTSVSWQSGLPWSIQRTQVSRDVLPPIYEGVGTPSTRLRYVYPTGERNDQRNKSYWNFDVRATKEWSLAGRVNLQLAIEIFNLFNDGTYQIYEPFGERGVQIDGTNVATGRFGRQFQLGAKVTF